MESAPLPRISGFTLLECLGRGGFGVVYRARQDSLDREVALKLLRPVGSADPETMTRFQREIDLQRDPIHPHLVRMLDAGRWEEGLFIALELVEGGSLQTWRRPTGIDLAKAVDLGLQVALGLQLDNLDDASVGAEPRRQGLQAMSRLCALLPKRLDGEPDLMRELRRLQRILRHRAELRASTELAPEIRSLASCLERFDTERVADPEDRGAAVER